MQSKVVDSPFKEDHPIIPTTLISLFDMVVVGERENERVATCLRLWDGHVATGWVDWARMVALRRVGDDKVVGWWEWDRVPCWLKVVVVATWVYSPVAVRDDGR